MGNETTKRRPPNAGKGRPRGTPNRLTADLRAMLHQALAEAGGPLYLRDCLLSSDARIKAAALGLLARLLPPPQAEAQPQVVVTWEP